VNGSSNTAHNPTKTNVRTAVGQTVWYGPVALTFELRPAGLEHGGDGREELLDRHDGEVAQAERLERRGEAVGPGLIIGPHGRHGQPQRREGLAGAQVPQHGGVRRGALQVHAAHARQVAIGQKLPRHLGGEVEPRVVQVGQGAGTERRRHEGVREGRHGHDRSAVLLEPRPETFASRLVEARHVPRDVDAAAEGEAGGGFLDIADPDAPKADRAVADHDPHGRTGRAQLRRIQWRQAREQVLAPDAQGDDLGEEGHREETSWHCHRLLLFTKRLLS
jgi:hypothetical protein